MKSSVFKFALSFVVVSIFGYSPDSSATEFRLAIDTLRGYQSSFIEVALRNLADANDSSLVNGKSVGHFSFLISYETECLSFVEARQGSMLAYQNWGFFSYQSQVNGSQGLIRITAIADTNRSDSLPSLPRANQGEWAVLKFRITSDRTFSGQCCPTSWYWLDCQNNVLSDSTGNASWLVDTLFTSNGFPMDLSTSFPTDVSRCDTILGAGSKRFVVFTNGYVCLPSCDECIDDRGDLNLNGIGYEIADFIFFENYFINGDGFLSSNPTHRQAQIAASDVNEDGLPLRVSDLVFMGRVIMGDANPLPKPNVALQPNSVDFQIVQEADRLLVSYNSPGDIGGVFLRLHFLGTAGEPVRLDASPDMDYGGQVYPGELRFFIASSLVSPPGKIPSGSGTLLSIPFNGNLRRVEIQASDLDGQEINAAGSFPIDHRGDLNADGFLTPSDVVQELYCIFQNSSPTCTLTLADLNCDGLITAADGVSILNAAFLLEPLPACNP